MAPQNIKITHAYVHVYTHILAYCAYVLIDTYCRYNGDSTDELI